MGEEHEKVRRDWCEEHNRGSLAATDGLCPECERQPALIREKHRAEHQAHGAARCPGRTVGRIDRRLVESEDAMKAMSIRTPDNGTAEGDRPSKHGLLLGSALAALAMAGRKDFPGDLTEPCLTCAFREGSQPNQSAGTGLIALNCVLGIDRDRFACHHGMKDGKPLRLCSGYIAARLAPWSFTKEVLSALTKDLSLIKGEDDDIRSAFDAWLSGADPGGKLDVYQQARKFAGARDPGA